MIRTTLVLGLAGPDREARIARELDPDLHTALILQGIPTGSSALAPSAQLDIARIAPGCPCCDGNLTLRVTLNRILRRRPLRLYIGLAPGAHLETVRAFLTAPPYDDFLLLTKDLYG